MNLFKCLLVIPNFFVHLYHVLYNMTVSEYVQWNLYEAFAVSNFIPCCVLSLIFYGELVLSNETLPIVDEVDRFLVLRM